ncbi:hypothetical protein CC80DRAFT_503698 [Byssothecium circinans]|uniref:Uncharacterized protein n=1 Tax=Byssothecium circinans TaxID=147558 RepID=A0A6A5U2X9_9PLEO|nr:hypothetical protein CC80DRAFT_503698 [Byssothecium circinans]
MSSNAGTKGNTGERASPWGAVPACSRKTALRLRLRLPPIFRRLFAFRHLSPSSIPSSTLFSVSRCSSGAGGKGGRRLRHFIVFGILEGADGRRRTVASRGKLTETSKAEASSRARELALLILCCIRCSTLDDTAVARHDGAALEQYVLEPMLPAAEVDELESSGAGMVGPAELAIAQCIEVGDVQLLLLDVDDAGSRLAFRSIKDCLLGGGGGVDYCDVMWYGVMAAKIVDCGQCARDGLSQHGDVAASKLILISTSPREKRRAQGCRPTLVVVCGCCCCCCTMDASHRIRRRR